VNQDRLNHIHLMLVSGLSIEAVRSAAIARLRMDPAEADAAIHEARLRLTLAADYHRDEQLGLAISRLNECYAKSLASGDLKTCVQVQRELNRLLRLYEQPMPTDTDGEPPEVVEARAHLANLGLGGPDTPLPELARLAAQEIVRLRSGQTN